MCALLLLLLLQWFDKDDSGYITVDELQSALKEHGDAAVVAAHITEILSDVDKDNVRSNRHTRILAAQHQRTFVGGVF